MLWEVEIQKMNSSDHIHLNTIFAYGDTHMISENVGNLLIFREKVLGLRPKSVCAVEMAMYVHWTCMNRNRKDDHA